MVSACASAGTANSATAVKVDPDPRVQQRTYRFKDTDEDVAYTVFISSKVKRDKPAPLIVALHGYGGDSNLQLRNSIIARRRPEHNLSQSFAQAQKLRLWPGLGIAAHS